MRAKDIKQKKLPDVPGVYFFLNKTGKILYIGKATSLRDRVKSYFSRDVGLTRGPGIVKMVAEASRVNFEKTDSVLEALILEASLIKKYRPPYNVREKDDRSFNYVVITNDEYPRVMVVRGRELGKKFPAKSRKHLFGPFPSGLVFREAMKLIRKLFPYYDTPRPVGNMTTRAQTGKVRFNRSLGLYPPQSTTKREYARTIKHIKLFLEGRKPELLRQLERDMRRCAKAHAFEQAEQLKHVIFGLTHIQDISLLRREVRELSAHHSVRIEAYDVAHLSGTNAVGVMVVVENGEVRKDEYRKFRIKEALPGSDTDALKEILSRRLKHDEWTLPNIIVVDGGRSQLNAATSVLKEFGYQIPIVSVVKNEQHRPRHVLGSREQIREHEADIVLANGEAHRFSVSYHRKIRRVR
jgi:excinuclease ABC subunit C